MRMLTPKRLLVALLGVSLAACVAGPIVPQATVVDYDRGFSFSQVRKVAIQPVPRDTLETMMMSDEQIGRVDQALRTELMRRDFQVVGENIDADMLLVWRFVPREKAAQAGFLNPAAQGVEQGTLYIDMVDPVMLRAVWRASFRTDLRDQPDTPEATRFRQQAAESVLAQFPPAR